MASLLSRLLGNGSRPNVDDDQLHTAIDRAIQRLEPRLRQAGGYPNRYREAVAHALAYVRKMASLIPGPVDISPEQYTRDPFVHALFCSAEEMQHALCLSHAMHEYARRPEGIGSEVYALMGMRRREKNALGMETEGNILRREVAQKVVYFTDHTLSGPAPTEAEARHLLMWNLFDSLLERVAMRLETRRKDWEVLEKEKDYLTAHLRATESDKRRQVQQRLNGVLAELGRATETLDLRRVAEDIDEVLLQPKEYIALKQTRLVLDGMGVIRNAEDRAAHDLEFVDLRSRDRRRWTLVLVRCHPDIGATSMADRLQQAGRWLQV